MNLKFDFFSIIIFLGVIQCLILSFIILTIKKGNKKTNIFLSLFLISGSLSISTGLLYKTNLFLYFPHLCKIGLNSQLLLGPFIFLYVKHLTSPLKKFRLKSLLHFIPFVFYIIFWSKFYFSPGIEKITYMQNWLNNNVSGALFYSEIIWSILIFINIWIYIILIFFVLKKHKKDIKNNYANIDKINLSWIKYLFISLIGLYAIIGVIIIIFLVFNIKYSKVNLIIPIFASIFIYTIGFKGLKQKDIFLNTAIHNISPTKRTLKKEEADNTFKHLIKYMENKKPYLKNNITLKQLSRNLLISVSKLSFIIDNYFRLNFYDFINAYRIKEAVKFLQSADYLNIDILYKKIGFDSKTVFLKTFKKITQQDPENYRKNFLIKKKWRKFKTIGIFIDSLYDKYGLNILKGAKKAANEEGYNLLCFNGGSINSPYYNYSQKTNIYNLTSMNNVDGIIAASSLLGTYISKDELLKFYDNFTPIPIVNIGMNLKEYPNILIDNEKGIRDVLRHLIEDHGYRKIAYINGPKNNIDAVTRFNIYKNILKEYNIKYNPKLVTSGNFIGISGKEAVITLLDKRKVHFDAVFAANDYMAIHAMKEFQQRGIRVPEDIAVVGFDDLPESRLLTTPLTTVFQPTFKLGYKAAKKLFQIINNEKVEKSHVLQTGMVIRNSCGCGKLNKNLLSINKKSHKDKIYMNLSNLKKYFIPEIEYLLVSKYGRLANPVEISSNISQILNELYLEIEDKNKSNYLLILKNLIEESIPQRIDIDFWEDLISFIFETILSNLQNSTKIQITKSLYTKSIDLVQVINRRIKEKQILQSHVQSNELILTKQALLSVQNIEDLKNILISELPKIGIQSCYLSIYENDNNFNINEYANLIMAYKDGNILNYDTDKIKFPANKLIPDGLQHSINNNIIILMSLYHTDNKIGFIIFETRPEHVDSLELLVLGISNTLNRIKLQTEITNINILKKAENQKTSKYEKSGLTKEMSENHYKKLLLFMMEEKIYTDPDLTLPLLAKRMDISRNHLSHIINDNSGLNFFDFINTYRIQEAKIILKNLKEKKINILNVAYNSGFKSKSTFNKLFKKYINMTPSEYKKKIN